MRVLVTGASGYIGSELIPHLLDSGHEVRAFARDPAKVRASVPVAPGDAVTGRGLDEALDGMEAAYFLIHSMEQAGEGSGSFSDRERRAAETFAAAAVRAGVERVVYLGGLVPAGARPSAHLASRLEVEHLLLEATPRSVALRASVVIGAGSRSFRFLVRLVERLRVLPLPAWRDRRTAPIDGRDVMASLLAALDTPPAEGRSLDIAGPEVLSYGAMIERIRDAMLVGRPVLGLGLTATPIASRVAAALAEEEHELIGPLMEGLEHDLLPRANAAADVLGVRLHSFDAAVENALREWESREPLKAR